VTLHAGQTLRDRLLKNGAQIAHDCGGKLACTSCRIVVRQALESLEAVKLVQERLAARLRFDNPNGRQSWGYGVAPGIFCASTPRASEVSRWRCA
jgi:uncharacterized 2Fe-2S/4Fe-4S cluster protein (DUF4445 family)